MAALFPNISFSTVASATNRVEKVGLMVGGIVVAMRRSKRFALFVNLDP